MKGCEVPIKSKYRISANSFRGNYSFLNLTLCTVTFGHSTYRCEKLFKGGNYSRAETIRGNTVIEANVKVKLVLKYI